MGAPSLDSSACAPLKAAPMFVQGFEHYLSQDADFVAERLTAERGQRQAAMVATRSVLRQMDRHNHA